MASGQGHYTPENEYFCRYFRLVNETGPKVLRKVLTFAAGSSTVEAYLNNKKTTINSLRARRILSQAQCDIIFPANNSPFNLESWDVTLLCAVIQNVCTLSSPLVKNEINSIRLARNAINHNPNPSFEKLDFEQKWSDFSRSINLLLTYCNDNDFEAKTLDEIETIQTSPLSIAPVLEVFYAYVKNNSETKEEILECQMKMNQMQGTLKRRLDKISKRVDEIYGEVRLYTRVSKPAIQDNELDASAQLLYDRTCSALRKADQYIPTEQMRSVERTLEEKGIVIISGGPGEGKTATALEVMRGQSKTKRCIQIFYPSEVHNIKPNQFHIVFIDDIFGNHELDESKRASWYPVLDKLYNLVNVNAFKLIIATREFVLKEIKDSVEWRKLFDNENIVFLKSENLSITEKENILSGALEVKEKPVKIELVQKCIKAFKSDLGFPYMCMLFASNEEFFKEEDLFFKRNNSVGGKFVSDLVQTKRIALMFIWIQGCTFVNRSEENDCLLSELSHCVKYEDELDEIYRKIHDHLETMEGVFVHRNKEGYQFLDNTIYDATGFYLVRIGMFEKIIKYCSIDFLMENISVKEDHYRADNVYIRKEYYNCLVDRVITEVLEKNNVNTVTMHACLNSVDVLLMLIDELKKRRIILDFLLSPLDNDYGNIAFEDKPFIYLICEKRSNISVCLLEQILKVHKPCRHIREKSKPCRMCIMYRYAWNGACRGGHTEVLKLLHFVKIEEKFLLDAVQSRNVGMFEYVSSKITARKKINWQNGHKALCIALENGDIPLYRAIKTNVCKPDTACLGAASRSRCEDLLVEVIKDLKENNNLIKDNNVDNVLDSLFSIKVLDAFTKAGIHVSEANIVYAIRKDIKSVENILWKLKYQTSCTDRELKQVHSDLWKKLCDNKIVRKILTDVGIIETEFFLLRSANAGEMHHVTDRLGQLILFDKWDCRSTFAKSLLKESLAYPELFRFLLKRDITLDDQTLLQAITMPVPNVNSISLIINKMKTTRKSMRRAFLLSVYNSEIYDLFLRKGMQPTAYHFLYVAERYDIGKDVTLSVFQNLFTVNAEKKKLDKKLMDTALLCVLQDENICQCFEDNGFYPDERAFVEYCVKGNLDKVKRTIHTLKTHGNWPLSLNTINKALKNSFFRKDQFCIIMRELHQFSVEIEASCYFALFVSRTQDIPKLVSTISKLKEADDWNPNDIILKVALLENLDNNNVSVVLQENGISTENILHHNEVLENTELQSYIMSELINTKTSGIDYSNLGADVILSMSKYPRLCRENLLERAVEIGELNDVQKIWQNLETQNSDFSKTNQAVNILLKCIRRPKVFKFLIKQGFVSDMKCLLVAAKKGKLSVFENTLQSLKHSVQNCSETREILKETIKRKGARFYTLLRVYSKQQLSPTLPDILLSLRWNNTTVLPFLLADIEKDDLVCDNDCIIEILQLNMKIFQLLCEMDLVIQPSTLLQAIHMYRSGELTFQQCELLIECFFEKHEWHLNDDNLQTLEEISEGDILFKIKQYKFSAVVSKVYAFFISGNEHELNNMLKSYQDEIESIVTGVLKQICECSREKCLSAGCLDVLNHNATDNDCNVSSKILICVLRRDLQGLLSLVVGLTLEEELGLDKTLILKSLEEALYLNETKLFCIIFDACSVVPSTYCLFYAILNKNEKCFHRVWKVLADSCKTCADPYYKASISLCSKYNDIVKLTELLKDSRITDTELFYDATICKNEQACRLLKSEFEKNRVWDLDNIWISLSKDICMVDNLNEIQYLIKVPEGIYQCLLEPVRYSQSQVRKSLPQVFSDRDETIFVYDRLDNSDTDSPIYDDVNY